jgi:hypothetical protein
MSFVVCSNTGGLQMRAIVIVVALVVALGFAYIADLYRYGGSYTRLVFHSLGAGFIVLVNNW